MIGEAEQSDRIYELGTAWFEKAFDATATASHRDATVARLAFEMCRAAHRHLAGENDSDIMYSSR